MRKGTSSLGSPRRFWPALSIVALISSACIPPDPDPNAISVEGNGEFTLVMSEFAFLPSSIRVDAGSTVTVKVVNDGVVEHELMVGRTVMPAGGYQQDLLELMLAEDDSPMVLESAFGQVGGHDETNSDGHHDNESTSTSHTGPTVPAEGTVDHHGEESGGDDHHDADAAAHGGSHITVQPSESIEVVLRVPDDAAGEWQIGCFLEGHFEEGMFGTMTVRQPSA